MRGVGFGVALCLEWCVRLGLVPLCGALRRAGARRRGLLCCVSMEDNHAKARRRRGLLCCVTMEDNHAKGPAATRPFVLWIHGG